jgi:hypothetical protein
MSIAVMKLSAFKTHLQNHPNHELAFILPDGDRVPAHAHITEAGRVDKHFIDCGGTVRRVSSCSLQAWTAADIEHRLAPGKLAGVLDLAGPLFRGDDLDVEVEYENGLISQFPVIESSADELAIYFHLGSKHTDCLAKETCLPESAGCGSQGCC